MPMNQTPPMDQLDPTLESTGDTGKRKSSLVAIGALVALVVIFSIVPDASDPDVSDPDAGLKTAIVALVISVMVLVVVAISMFGGQRRFWMSLRAFIICGLFAAPFVFSFGARFLDGDSEAAVTVLFASGFWVFGTGYLIRSNATKAVGIVLLGVTALIGGVSRLIDGHQTGALALIIGGALMAIGVTSVINVDITRKVAIVNTAFVLMGVTIVIGGAVAILNGDLSGTIALAVGAWLSNAARKNKLVVVRESDD